MSNVHTMKRYCIFIVGLFFMGLGVALITKSNLGTSPISSVPYVLSMIFPITIGQFTFLLNLVFLLIQIILLGRHFPKKQYFQVLVGPFFGLFIDLGMFIFYFVNPDFYVGKLLALLLGCIVLALGVYLQVEANVILNPGEGLIKVLADKTRIKFGSIKIMFDWTLVIIAAMISLFAFQAIKGIGIGTIISAFLVGYIIKAFSNLLQCIHYR